MPGGTTQAQVGMMLELVGMTLERRETMEV
jgi:hypothetical protein